MTTSVIMSLFCNPTRENAEVEWGGMVPVASRVLSELDVQDITQTSNVRLHGEIRTLARNLSQPPHRVTLTPGERLNVVDQQLTRLLNFLSPSVPAYETASLRSMLDLVVELARCCSNHDTLQLCFQMIAQTSYDSREVRVMLTQDQRVVQICDRALRQHSDVTETVLYAIRNITWEAKPSSLLELTPTLVQMLMADTQTVAWDCTCSHICTIIHNLGLVPSSRLRLRHHRCIPALSHVLHSRDLPEGGDLSACTALLNLLSPHDPAAQVTSCEGGGHGGGHGGGGGGGSSQGAFSSDDEEVMELIINSGGARSVIGCFVAALHDEDYPPGTDLYWNTWEIAMAVFGLCKCDKIIPTLREHNVLSLLGKALLLSNCSNRQQLTSDRQWHTVDSDTRLTTYVLMCMWRLCDDGSDDNDSYHHTDKDFLLEPNPALD